MIESGESNMRRQSLVHVPPSAPIAHRFAGKPRRSSPATPPPRRTRSHSPVEACAQPAVDQDHLLPYDRPELGGPAGSHAQHQNDVGPGLASMATTPAWSIYLHASMPLSPFPGHPHLVCAHSMTLPVTLRM
jgi:hypothetical protein